VVFTLRVLYALVPCLCNAAALVIATAYPISGDLHREIRDAISRQAEGGPVYDPLAPGKLIDRRS